MQKEDLFGSVAAPTAEKCPSLQEVAGVAPDEPCF